MNNDEDLCVGDLKLEVIFSELRLDAERSGSLGRYVQELDLKVFRISEDERIEVFGELKCFLFDAIGAEANNDQMFPEPDYDGEPMEFYEFLFSLDTGFVRGRLLHLVSPDSFDDEDDEDGSIENSDLHNVLCVSQGWWRCRPEILVHVLRRLTRTLKFDFVCVDAAHIQKNPLKGEDHRTAETPLVLPDPFKKATWGKTTDPNHLTEDAREIEFWIAPTDQFEEKPPLADEAPVRLGSIRLVN